MNDEDEDEKNKEAVWYFNKPILKVYMGLTFMRKELLFWQIPERRLNYI